MSRLNPFKPPYPSLTGEIGFQLRGVVGLIKQHNAIHKESKPFLEKMIRLVLEWEKLPYPKEVERNNESNI